MVTALPTSTAGLPDRETRRALRIYLDRVRLTFPASEAVLFGSRARGTHRPESDADLLLVFCGPVRSRFEVAAELASMAFDVMQETGVLVDPLPIWETELANPSTLPNPALVDVIRREGLQV